MNDQETIELLAFATRDVSQEIERIKTFLIDDIESNSTFLHRVIHECMQQKPVCKKLLMDRIVPILMEIAVSQRASCTVLIQRQIFKMINDIVRATSKALRTDFCLKNGEILKKVASLLTTVGDYDAQIVITEFLLRIVTSQDCADEVICDRSMAQMFFSISKQTFETDARNYINELNRRCGEDAKVWTYPCITVEVGHRQVYKPAESHYLDFWVDFNEGNSSILLFCQFDDGASSNFWNALTIFESQVKDVTLVYTNASIILEITLNCKSHELFDSATDRQFTGNFIKITFKLGTPISVCIPKVFRNHNLQVAERASKPLGLSLTRKREVPTALQNEVSTSSMQVADRASKSYELSLAIQTEIPSLTGTSADASQQKAIEATLDSELRDNLEPLSQTSYGLKLQDSVTVDDRLKSTQEVEVIENLELSDPNETNSSEETVDEMSLSSEHQLEEKKTVHWNDSDEIVESSQKIHDRQNLKFGKSTLKKKGGKAKNQKRNVTINRYSLRHRTDTLKSLEVASGTKKALQEMTTINSSSKEDSAKIETVKSFSKKPLQEKATINTTKTLQEVETTKSSSKEDSALIETVKSFSKKTSQEKATNNTSSTKTLQEATVNSSSKKDLPIIETGKSFSFVASEEMETGKGYSMAFRGPKKMEYRSKGPTNSTESPSAEIDKNDLGAGSEETTPKESNERKPQGVIQTRHVSGASKVVKPDYKNRGVHGPKKRRDKATDKSAQKTEARRSSIYNFPLESSEEESDDDWLNAFLKRQEKKKMENLEKLGGSALDKPSKERGGATSLAVAQTSPTVKPEVVKVLVNKLTTKKKPQADVSLSSNTRDQY